MAIWQFYYIITFTSESHVDKFCEDIQLIFNKQKSRSNEIVQYGDLDGSCIQVLYDKNVYDEISGRFDLRNITRETIIKIYDIINSNGLIIQIEGKNISTIQELFYYIQNSPSYKFVQNPRNFLENLSND